MNQNIIFIFLLIKCFIFSCNCSLSDVTHDLFGNSANGIVAAFGDFDADKSTDIFLLANDGKSVTVMLGHVVTSTGVIDEPFERRMILDKDDIGSFVISSIIPSDFDGDSMMDLLLTMTDANLALKEIRIYWGNGVNVNRDKYLVIKETLSDTPALFDYNGDMIPDLLSEDTATNSRAFWIFSPYRNYTLQYLKNETTTDIPALWKPQSSAFVDFNGDFASDLVVMSVDETTKMCQFEIWFNEEGNFVWNSTVGLPSEIKFPGYPAFIDLNGDYEIDILLPWCSDDACATSSISVYSKNKWHKLKFDLKDAQNNQWSFVPMSDNPVPWMKVPPMLRIGDFNLNSFPDAVAVFTTVINGEKTYGVFVMENVGCGTECDGYSRKFAVSFGSPLVPLSKEPLHASYFDLMDNGVLDILVNKINAKTANITALKQLFSDDACFMKVTVTSGLCNNDCYNSHKPYGVNQIGPVVQFETTTAEGSTQMGIATQLTQSSYFALQMPFVHFGLGQVPNFVDKLHVGIQPIKGETTKSKEWTQIIPNSQLVIIPYPNDRPSSWVNKLFVTPSRLVLLTGAALLGTCGFIAGIVGILHWRERVEDKLEKLQDSHKFHFDAM